MLLRSAYVRCIFLIKSGTNYQHCTVSELRSSSCKLVSLLVVSIWYCFGVRGIVFVVCTIVPLVVSSHSCKTLRELLQEPSVSADVA